MAAAATVAAAIMDFQCVVSLGTELTAVSVVAAPRTPHQGRLRLHSPIHSIALDLLTCRPPRSRHAHARHDQFCAILVRPGTAIP